MSAAPRALVSDTPPFPIRPWHINTGIFLHQAFGHEPTALVAEMIVRRCQDVDGWAPFMRQTLPEYRSRNFRRPSVAFFQRLIEPERIVSSLAGESLHGGGWIVLERTGLCRITEDFVRECYRASPAWPVNLPYHRVVEDEPDFPVQPKDIDLEESLRWAFPDGVDGEVAHHLAAVIIRGCASKGSWIAFSFKGDGDLAPLSDPTYVWKKGEKVPITAGFIVRGEDGLYRVTDDFIFRCYGRAGRHERRATP